MRLCLIPFSLLRRRYLSNTPRVSPESARPSGYDVAPDDFAAEMDRLWLQVKPLYDALHAFTRNGLERAYGARGAAPDGRIPAHLLGNMWSRDGLEAGHLYVVRDPLRRDRLQHLYLSVGMRRPKMLDVS